MVWPGRLGPVLLGSYNIPKQNKLAGLFVSHRLAHSIRVSKNNNLKEIRVNDL